MQSSCRSTNQTSLKFAEKILQGQAINVETSEKAVEKIRLDIATSLLRESGVNIVEYCLSEQIN